MTEIIFEKVNTVENLKVSNYGSKDKSKLKLKYT